MIDRPEQVQLWNRRRFLFTASAIPAGACLPWQAALAAKIRTLPNSAEQTQAQGLLSADELNVLSYASFAPSGHNTQPWTVQIVDRGHWLIGTSQERRLPAVDPANRETTLSVGAFLENLVIAAQQLGYAVDYQVVAKSATDTPLIDLRLRKASAVDYPIARLETRRTVRTGYANEPIKSEDLQFITDASKDFAYFVRGSKLADYLSEATIEANRKQAYRDPAQEELANWIRWSKQDQARHQNGLTPAGMEITGVGGWFVSNFFDRDSVMKKSFREKGIKQVVERVNQGGGWLVQSGGSRVADWIETGRKFQRMWLKLRERGIAIHPMTQMLEETPRTEDIAKTLGIDATPQFILRIGYVKNHPDPVSPRMPVAWFTRAANR
jgi:hypothetical protein